MEKRNEIPGEESSQVLWGSDALISSVGSGLIWLASSHSADMPNNRTYVAVVKHLSGVEDTVYHYFSDDGLNWDEWYHVYYPFGNEVWQAEILVGRGTNPWIYTFMRSTSEGEDSSGALVLRRLRADGSEWDWIHIVEPGDSVGRFAVDMDENEVLYLAYEKIRPAGGKEIRVTKSTDCGLTWSSPLMISLGNRRSPEIAIGKNNYFYIAYVAKDSIIRIGRNDNSLEGNWVFNDVQTDAEFEYTPSIAVSRLQTSPGQTAWVLYRDSHTTAYDVHYAYTTDGGVSWTFGVWEPMNYYYGDIRYPWVETAFDYPYDVCVAIAASYPSSGYDSIVTVWHLQTTQRTGETGL